MYYTADNAEELTTALTEILDNIIEQDVSFTAPAVAVNTFNRLTHRDELYVSMFKPTNNPRWEGNVKRTPVLGGRYLMEEWDIPNMSWGPFKGIGISGFNNQTGESYPCSH